MVSVVPENWLNIKISDDLDEIDVLEIDNGLLILLLQDSPVENSDDERLLSVIKSLEAEIDPHNIVMNVDDHHISSVAEPTSNGHLEDCQSSDAWQTKDQEYCSTTEDHDLDFSWINDVEMVSSPIMGDEMNMWCMDPYDDELHNRSVEFGEVRDYYYCQKVLDVVAPLEEAGYSTSLWQETYDLVMYG